MVFFDLVAFFLWKLLPFAAYSQQNGAESSEQPFGLVLGPAAGDGKISWVKS